MRFLICLLVPWLGFFTFGQILKGIVCLILQLTLIGWPFAAMWAVYSLIKVEMQEQIQEAFAKRGL